MSLSISPAVTPGDQPSTETARPAATVAPSELLSWPGAVPAEGADAGLAWHYGDPMREQRSAETTAALFDRSIRSVLVVPGPDRLEWLHAITSQHLSRLGDGENTEALVLSPNGHVEQYWSVTELGDTIWIDTDAGAGPEVLAYLLKMRFLKRVEPADVTADFAVLRVLGPDAERVLVAAGEPWAVSRAVGRSEGGFVRPIVGGAELVLPRPAMTQVASALREAGAAPAGTWAAEALRAAARRPRLGAEIDHRTIPQEVGLIGSAVHLDKGCYRGQETVARVQNLGKPPRRLVLMHMSGDTDRLPASGTAVERDGKAVGYVGTAVQHWELGPIALAVVKRTVGTGDALTVAGFPVSIDPDDLEANFATGFAGSVGPAATTV